MRFLYRIVQKNRKKCIMCSLAKTKEEDSKVLDLFSILKDALVEWTAEVGWVLPRTRRVFLENWISREGFSRAASKGLNNDHSAREEGDKQKNYKRNFSKI